MPVANIQEWEAPVGPGKRVVAVNLDDLDEATLFTAAGAANTAAVSAAGVVTFAGDAPDAAFVAVGLVLTVSGNKYRITEVNAGVPTVTPAQAAAAAADYTISQRADYGAGPGESRGFLVANAGADMGTVVVRSVAADTADPDLTVTLAAGATWTACGVQQFARYVRQSSTARSLVVSYH